MSWFRRDSQRGQRSGEHQPGTDPQADHVIAQMSWRPYGAMTSDLVGASSVIAENMGQHDPRLPYAEAYLGALHRALRHQIHLYDLGYRVPDLMPVVSPEQPEGTIALVGLLQSGKHRHTEEFGLGPTDQSGSYDENRVYDPAVSRLAAEARETVNAALVDMALNAMLAGPGENPPLAA